MSSVPTSIIATVCVTSLSLFVVPPVNVALGITATTSASPGALASIITTSADGCEFARRRQASSERRPPSPTRSGRAPRVACEGSSSHQRGNFPAALVQAFCSYSTSRAESLQSRCHVQLDRRRARGFGLRPKKLPLTAKLLPLVASPLLQREPTLLRCQAIPDGGRAQWKSSRGYRTIVPKHRTFTHRTPHRRSNCWGTAARWSKVRELIALVADTDATVLIRGESGTGKELVARSLRALSSRRDRAFVKVNCAALPGDLLESEMFGFERGAFSGALQAKPGKFEFANHGTIFLDEIGEMPAAAPGQAAARAAGRPVLPAWVAREMSRSTCASSPRPIVTSKTRSPPDTSGRICSSA